MTEQLGGAHLPSVYQPVHFADDVSKVCLVLPVTPGWRIIPDRTLEVFMHSAG